jgi:hypothetical protein
MSQSLSKTFAELERDLIPEGGPRISTMRNYRFCIVVYPPEKEFALRREVQKLGENLEQKRLGGQDHLPAAAPVRAAAPARGRHRVADRAREGRLGPQPAARADVLEQKLTRELEGPEGIAMDVAREIGEFVTAHPDKAERTVALIGRAGALYPFFRNSALLKHIDGHTHHVPVVLLYPGVREGATGLSFMGQYRPDTDYRPRIYG